MDMYATFLQGASKTPPITPDTLAELDMPRIINNPKLRHDVNFDRELHFRPNLDGAKGKEKVKTADEYWHALEPEVYLLNKARRILKGTDDETTIKFWRAVMTKSRKRLRKVFEVVRNVLSTLVSDADQVEVEDRLDVDHLFQEIDNGTYGLADLAKWLATVMKKHCAPMRDHVVDEMQCAISQGVFSNNEAALCDGLRRLLKLLEDMRLDVTNHQIRAMRPMLIPDTLTFRRLYDLHRAKMQMWNSNDSSSWLETAHRLYRLYSCKHDGEVSEVLADERSSQCVKILQECRSKLCDTQSVAQVHLNTAYLSSAIRAVFRDSRDRNSPEQETVVDPARARARPGGHAASRILKCCSSLSLVSFRRKSYKSLRALLYGLALHLFVPVVLAQDQIDTSISIAPDTVLADISEPGFAFDQYSATVTSTTIVLLGVIWTIWVARRPWRKCVIPPSYHVFSGFAIACAGYVMRGAGEDREVQRVATALWCLFILPGLAKLARPLRHPLLYLVFLITVPVALALHLAASGWTNSDISDTVLTAGPVGLPAWAVFVHLCQRGHEEWPETDEVAGESDNDETEDDEDSSSDNTRTGSSDGPWAFLSAQYLGFMAYFRRSTTERSRAPDEEHGMPDQTIPDAHADSSGRLHPIAERQPPLASGSLGRDSGTFTIGRDSFENTDSLAGAGVGSH
ncbi:hypothetical protein B0A48_15418 [Cryoendolithus antarcticus]|uniref:Uncharacterized protein n=1 Tax=Cryoendolithus antarcticus TaxID=1507870 RepID=A0A1V8SHY5_9PEZI|nr:hypothetical protein B0A48_15418 [Cryoendolithus antarcticus]